MLHLQSVEAHFLAAEIIEKDGNRPRAVEILRRAQALARADDRLEDWLPEIEKRLKGTDSFGTEYDATRREYAVKFEDLARRAEAAGHAAIAAKAGEKGKILKEREPRPSFETDR